ncbi:MAG: hypothetical protein ACYSR8_06010 [Planctomycetota bacterium]|jgi:hypothetical protein
MVNFSKDTDILKYEPVLFGELHLPWQVLATGTGGSLSGTTFTANDADFVSAPITAGQVIYVWSADGSLETALEIVSVDSATELTVSVVRADSDGVAIAPPPYLAFDYRIGDRVITSSQSRDLLECRSDNRSVRWIKRVHMDFKNQCTNLKIIRQRTFHL